MDDFEFERVDELCNSSLLSMDIAQLSNLLVDDGDFSYSDIDDEDDDDLLHDEDLQRSLSIRSTEDVKDLVESLGVNLSTSRPLMELSPRPHPDGRQPHRSQYSSNGATSPDAVTGVSGESPSCPKGESRSWNKDDTSQKERFSASSPADDTVVQNTTAPQTKPLHQKLNDQHQSTYSSQRHHITCSTVDDDFARYQRAPHGPVGGHEDGSPTEGSGVGSTPCGTQGIAPRVTDPAQADHTATTRIWRRNSQRLLGCSTSIDSDAMQVAALSLDHETDVQAVSPFSASDMALLQSEEGLFKLFELISKTTSHLSLQGWDNMAKIHRIVSVVYQEDYSSLDLCKFPEFVVRAIACCASSVLLVQIEETKRGVDLFPWEQYARIRFPLQMELINILPGNYCVRFYSLLLTTSSKRLIGRFDAEHELSNKRLVRQGSGLATADDEDSFNDIIAYLNPTLDMNSMSLDDILTQLESPADGEHPESPSQQQRLTNQNKQRSASSSSKESTVTTYQCSSLVNLCIEYAVENNLSWENLPFELHEGMVAEFFRVSGSHFDSVDLGKMPQYNALQVIMRASPVELLQVPKANRGAYVHPWNLFSEKRFGEEAIHKHRFLKSVLKGVDLFYMLLLKC